jgi:hypothetical protein
MTKAATKAASLANLKPPFKKGQSGNPKGYPKGQRNYATIYREALMKIAASQNMSFEEMENILVQSGLSKAIKGDYKFYQDVMDRVHGKPQQSIDHTTGGEKLEGLTVKLV